MTGRRLPAGLGCIVVYDEAIDSSLADNTIKIAEEFLLLTLPGSLHGLLLQETQPQSHHQH